MSYDLVVFEPNAAPSSRGQFLVWYREQTKWGEGHGYNDPTVPTPKLRSWFMDIIQKFPPLNGPLSKSQEPLDEESETDYSLGRTLIYCSFAWSKAEQAYETVFELAEKHGVGFLDASSQLSEVWLPKGGGLFLAHSD